MIVGGGAKRWLGIALAAAAIASCARADCNESFYGDGEPNLPRIPTTL